MSGDQAFAFFFLAKPDLIEIEPDKIITQTKNHPNVRKVRHTSDFLLAFIDEL